MQRLESRLMPADIQIRLHHFILPDVREAFRGTTPVEELAEERIQLNSVSSTDSNPVAYIRDVFGTTKQDRNHFRISVEEFYRQLRELPDSATVLLSRGLDGICKSACIGRHCTLFYRKYKNDDSDARALREIVDNLRYGRYRFGRDWEQISTTNLMFDSRGTHLSVPTVPIPVVEVFPAIVAKAGALRGK